MGVNSRFAVNPTLPDRWAVTQQGSKYVVGGVSFDTQWAAQDYAKFCRATDAILADVQTTLHDTRYSLTGTYGSIIGLSSGFNIQDGLIVKSRRGKVLVSMTNGGVDEISLTEFFLVAVPVDLWVLRLRKAAVTLWYGTRRMQNAATAKVG